MHAEYTIRAAKAGKHVLCEKPMAISSAECRQMIDACRQHNVKLMIAYRVHYDPMWQQIRDMARSGAIGEIQGFQGGFYGSKTSGWRLDRKLAGGGSLLDLGIYPMNTIRWIAGEEPASFSAQMATRMPGPRFASVEESIEFTMKFPSGILASSGSSYGEEGGAYLGIGGTQGRLWVEPAFYYQGLKFTGSTIHGPVSATSMASSHTNSPMKRITLQTAFTTIPNRPLQARRVSKIFWPWKPFIAPPVPRSPELGAWHGSCQCRCCGWSTSGKRYRGLGTRPILNECKILP